MRNVLAQIYPKRLPQWTAPEQQLELTERETTVAVATVVLSIASLIAIYIDPTEPSRFANVAYGLLIAFVLFAIAVLATLRTRKRITPRFSVVVHITTVAWASIISLFTSGPNSAFFVFFVFVIVAAAFRWRMRASLATTAVLVTVLVVQGWLFSRPDMVRRFGEYDLNQLIMRAVYLFIIGFFAGYLSDRGKDSAYQIEFINDLSRQLATLMDVREQMQNLAARIASGFVAQRVLVFLESSGFCCLADATAVAGSRWSELTRSEGEDFRFPMSAATLMVEGAESAAITATGAVAENTLVLPASVNALFFRSLIVAEAHPEEQFHLRLFIVDPRNVSVQRPPFSFLTALMAQVAPILYASLMVRERSEQIEAHERARIGRELHDSTLQNLSSVQLQLDSLKTKLSDRAAEAGDIDRIRTIIHNEILDLRDLVYRVRVFKVEPEQFVTAVAHLAERFERDTGISATVETAVHEIKLNAPACGEVLSILQEALINVRKHSAARTVFIRLEQTEAGNLEMTVDDDGRGFPFQGSLTWSELLASDRGPDVIKERIRMLGGQLTIMSRRAEGSSLRFILPAQAVSEP